MRASNLCSDNVALHAWFRSCAGYRQEVALAQLSAAQLDGGMLDKIKSWARALKRDVVALWIAARDPRVPWYAKAAAGVVAAYALSPIDLIPDFVPILGYLDDLLIVPLGILLVVKLIRPGLMAEFREQAAARSKPTSYVGLAIIGAIWLAVIVALVWWIWLR